MFARKWCLLLQKSAFKLSAFDRLQFEENSLSCFSLLGIPFCFVPCATVNLPLFKKSGYCHCVGELSSGLVLPGERTECNYLLINKPRD